MNAIIFSYLKFCNSVTPQQEVECMFLPLETGWVFVSRTNRVQWNDTVWLPKIGYKIVMHFLDGTLPVCIQASWCKEDQEAPGEAKDREWGLYPTVRVKFQSMASTNLLGCEWVIVKVDLLAPGEVLRTILTKVLTELQIHEQNKWLLLL